MSDLHTIYWEVSGSAGGEPVVVLHGGPGGGSQPDYRHISTSTSTDCFDRPSFSPPVHIISIWNETFASRWFCLYPLSLSLCVLHVLANDNIIFIYLIDGHLHSICLLKETMYFFSSKFNLYSSTLPRIKIQFLKRKHGQIFSNFAQKPYLGTGMWFN